MEEIRVVPATAERWADLEQLFGKNGACAGCWCMFWRLDRKDYKAMQGEGNRQALRALVLNGCAPGVIAYAGEQPAGWCAVAPREDYRALENSRILKRVDDRPVWSITCYFVARPYRRKGVARALLKGAVEFALSQGARIVEGYPIDLESPTLAGKKLTGVGGYMGIASLYRDLGFVEVAQASDTQRIMRYEAAEG